MASRCAVLWSTCCLSCASSCPTSCAPSSSAAAACLARSSCCCRLVSWLAALSPACSQCCQQANILEHAYFKKRPPTTTLATGTEHQMMTEGKNFTTNHGWRGKKIFSEVSHLFLSSEPRCKRIGQGLRTGHWPILKKIRPGKSIVEKPRPELEHFGRARATFQSSYVRQRFHFSS
jgi:hypothetical protein